MINLLPSDVKESITYARHNTRLRNWTIAMLISIISISAVITVGHIYLQQSINSYASQANQGNEDLKTQKLEDTQKQVQDITDSLKLVVQVLQRQILFSKLLVTTGSALPSGSVLTNLSIDKVQGGINLQAAAINYQTATQVQLNLQDPKNKIFEKADIVSIQCTDPAGASAESITNQYPCSIQIRALFASKNAFTFIESGVKQ